MNGDRIAPWEVRRTRTTYQDRWLRVRSDDCVDADGREIAPYHVIEYPDWINVVPLTPEGRLIVVREYRHGRGEVMTGLVSGTLEAIDRLEEPGAAERAARRELEEETGYHAARFQPVLRSYPNSANHNNVVTTFLALDAEPRSAPKLDASEAIELVLEDLPSLMVGLRDGAVAMQAMHVAGLWSAVARILAETLKFAAADTLRRALADVLT